MASIRVGMTMKSCFKKASSYFQTLSIPAASSSTVISSPLSSLSSSLSTLSSSSPSSLSNRRFPPPSRPFASFSTSSPTRDEKRENLYNPYAVAATPEEAAELEPPVRYYKDTRFDEPDYDMPKDQVLARYAEHQPADLFTEFTGMSPCVCVSVPAYVSACVCLCLHT